MEGKNKYLYNINCTGFLNDAIPYGGFRIEWNANIGFGQFDVVFDENGKAHLHTEYMCDEEDKTFAKELMLKMVDEAIIED